MTTGEGMKFAFIVAAIEESPYWDPMTEEAAEAIWDEWIARVRRDAAREALDGLASTRALMLAGGIHQDASGMRDVIRDYRDTHYPEETA